MKNILTDYENGCAFVGNNHKTFKILETTNGAKIKFDEGYISIIIDDYKKITKLIFNIKSNKTTQILPHIRQEVKVFRESSYFLGNDLKGCEQIIDKKLTKLGY